MISHAIPSLRVVPHDFAPADLCSGHVALDFVNTAAGLNRDPRDWLDGYARLVEWAEVAGICDAALRRKLIAQDRASPGRGRAALVRARLLRSALYALIHCIRNGIRPPAVAVEELQQWCRRGGAGLQLRWHRDGSLHSTLDACSLNLIGVTVALAAVELLSQPLAGQLGVCAGRNCGWLFLDMSKSRRRRWCDMKTCGNAAKASRHYRRQRLAAGA
jgi:predicted RNA-binding Zn ribbon-like protein